MKEMLQTKANSASPLSDQESSRLKSSKELILHGLIPFPTQIKKCVAANIMVEFALFYFTVLFSRECLKDFDI